jgi:hypothetical protein
VRNFRSWWTAAKSPIMSSWRTLCRPSLYNLLPYIPSIHNLPDSRSPLVSRKHSRSSLPSFCLACRRHHNDHRALSRVGRVVSARAALIQVQTRPSCSGQNFKLHFRFARVGDAGKKESREVYLGNPSVRKIASLPPLATWSPSPFPPKRPLTPLPGAITWCHAGWQGRPPRCGHLLH